MVDRQRIQELVEGISAAAATLDSVRLMEVCGTHTVSLFRSGVKSLLPERVRLISGPGCPVCVTSAGYVDTACELAGREGVLLHYTTSGALTGSYTNSVSYAAIALCRGAAAELAEPERQCLLKLARDQVREHLRSGKPLAEVEKRYPLTPRLKKPGPAFVTLTRAGRLRGCIGHVVPVKPLYQSVLENAVNACRDPRFRVNPVTAAEEPALHIEVSVLSRHRQTAGVDDIKVGRDGLIIRRGRNQGLLLPQVPVQQKWDKPRYLAELCRKAGLPLEAWKDPQTRIYRFSAQVFGEPHPATASGPAEPKP